MPANHPPSRDEREKLGEEDDRNESDIVLSTPTSSSSGAYAYHDPDDDGDPRCGAGGPDTEFQELTVTEARRRNKSPCGFCDSLK
jgi:hypothetical protein